MWKHDEDEENWTRSVKFLKERIKKLTRLCDLLSLDETDVVMVM